MQVDYPRSKNTKTNKAKLVGRQVTSESLHLHLLQLTALRLPNHLLALQRYQRESSD